MKGERGEPSFRVRISRLFYAISVTITLVLVEEKQAGVFGESALKPRPDAETWSSRPLESRKRDVPRRFYTPPVLRPAGFMARQLYNPPACDTRELRGPSRGADQSQPDLSEVHCD